jgi:hypothetical protein
MLALIFTLDSRNLSYFRFRIFKFFLQASQLGFSIVEFSLNSRFLNTLLLKHSLLLEKYFLHLCGVLIVVTRHRLLALQHFVLDDLLFK